MFEKLIGNEEAKSYLEKCVLQKNYSHSYMFLGAEGIGKKLFAKEFSRNILCLNKEKFYINDDLNNNSNNAKNENNNIENDLNYREKFENNSNEKNISNGCSCSSCIKFDSGNHPDFEIIEPDGKSVKIEQIRNLQDKMANKPIISENKIFIIDNAETMTEESQNCLLKTLEEPPKYGIIILIVSNESKILPTIKSRCVTLKFNKICDEELRKNFPELNYEEIEILNGSLKQKDEIKEKLEEHNEINSLVSNLNKGIPYLMNNSDVLYNGKDNIFELLDYLNIVLFKNKMYNKIEFVEKTKQKLEQNNNFEMSIDYLIINLCKENL